jgi:hypothetical protein
MQVPFFNGRKYHILRIELSHDAKLESVGSQFFSH